MTPFTYPRTRHTRRHGPGGYSNYERYRPWLRDEFTFRCVYCLKREQWGIVRGTYDIDHFVPQSRQPDASIDYENLFYACTTCNTAKGSATVPNPGDCLLDGDVEVRENGAIEGRTPDATKLIRVLGLDDPEYREFRMLWIGVVQMARHHAPESLHAALRFPAELPNLKLLRPPRNTRPEGIERSYRARRDRGELPDVY
jgi:hypothetical protein